MKVPFKDQVIALAAQVKSLFAEEPAAGDPAPVDSLKEYETSTGVKVKIDKLEVGGKVFQEDGVTPVIVGFTLADGTDVQVDPTGVITAVTVPAADPTPADPNQFTPQQIAMQDIAAKFAAGTPEERMANLETMAKAMMQYCFGWKIDDATRKAIEDQAIAAYKSLGVPSQFAEQSKTLVTEQFAELKKAQDAHNKKVGDAIGRIVALMEQFAAQPAADPIQLPFGGADPFDTKMERAAGFLKTIRNESEAIGAEA